MTAHLKRLVSRYCASRLFSRFALTFALKLDQEHMFIVQLYMYAQTNTFARII